MINKNILRIIPVMVLLTFPLHIPAQESADDIYDKAVATFWDNIYLSGGWTLYCGFKFDHTRKTEDGKIIGIEQIYPTSWMIKHLKCASRMQCHQSKNNQLIRMESDLHNMYPDWMEISRARGDTGYGIIAGEDWRFDGCDFERKQGITEPRPDARGNIARAIFYMKREYGLPVDEKLLTVLKTWNREDPPSEQEKQRNDKIQAAQGKRNPFIDNPALADRISVSQPNQ